MGGSLTEAELADILLPELLSPTLVTLIAGSDSFYAAQEFITNTLDDLLKGTFPNARYFPQQWGYKPPYIADRNRADESGFELIRTKQRTLEDQWGHVIDPPEFRSNVLDSFYDEFELSSIVNKFLEEENLSKILEPRQIIQESKTDSAFRLDVIDFALYQTLLKHPELIRSIKLESLRKTLS